MIKYIQIFSVLLDSRKPLDHTLNPPGAGHENAHFSIILYVLSFSCLLPFLCFFGHAKGYLVNL